MGHIVTFTKLHRRDVLCLTDNVYYRLSLVHSLTDSVTEHNIFMVI